MPSTYGFIIYSTTGRIMGKLNMEMQPNFISDIRIFLPIIRCRRHTKGMGKA